MPDSTTSTSDPAAAPTAPPAASEGSEATTTTDLSPAGATPNEATLGQGGKSAIAKERQARREAEQRATSAESRLAEIERDQMVAEVAAEAGLPDEMARRLSGTTRDELAADAAELAETLAETRPSIGRAPRSDIGQHGDLHTPMQGRDGDVRPDPRAVADLIRQRTL